MQDSALVQHSAGVFSFKENITMFVSTGRISPTNFFWHNSPASLFA
jgi:hypothetical protein